MELCSTTAHQHQDCAYHGQRGQSIHEAVGACHPRLRASTWNEPGGHHPVHCSCHSPYLFNNCAHQDSYSSCISGVPQCAGSTFACGGSCAHPPTTGPSRCLHHLPTNCHGHGCMTATAPPFSHACALVPTAHTCRAHTGHSCDAHWRERANGQQNILPPCHHTSSGDQSTSPGTAGSTMGGALGSSMGSHFVHEHSGPTRQSTSSSGNRRLSLDQISAGEVADSHPWSEYRHRQNATITRRVRQLPVPPVRIRPLPNTFAERGVTHQPRGSTNDSLSSPLSPSMHFLDRSSVRLDRANLTNVGGDFNYSVVYESASKPTGRDILLSKILPQAMHGNEGPSDEQRCHGRTHHSITGDIKSWLQTKNRLHNVLLLIGPAGTGKTILTKTVIADLNQPDSPTKLAGSFFFSSGDSGRNSAERFVLTLAYQLTGLATEIGQRIDHILNRDPHISTSGLEQQWRRLIIEPVNGMSDVLPPSVFIIEGLDQCGTPLEQSQVLQLVASSGSTFPIAFFITSKPEYHIRTFFKADALAVLCRKAISLTEITTEVRNDVKAFLRSRLADIHARNRDILGPVPLASEADIQNLARSAAGHFIYVSAFLRFIDDHRENPRIRAEQYFSRSREATHALTPLDGYYGHILSKSHHPTNSFVQNILFHIIFCNEVDMVASLSRIAALEGCNTHLIRTALRHLHSVLEVPEEDHEHVRVYDPSFIDYLYDYERSGSYFIDRSYYAALTVVQCLKNLTHTSHNRHPQWWFDNSYGWLRYIEHVNLASPPQDFIFSLQQFDFHRWLSEYARQPYSLHNRYAVFQKLLKRSSLGKYLQDLHPDTLVEARHFWLAELCSYNIEVGRIYLQLLGRLPVVPRLPTWSAIHSLVSTHLRLTGLSLQLDTNWPLFCYAVEEVVPSVPNWFMGDSQLSQQFAHVEGCMSRHDVVLAALTILRHPEYLSYDDLGYFSLHWSAAWDWESELWCDMPSKEALEPIRVQTILAALGRLPKQFHKHALHSPQVLAWIETHLPDAIDLYRHWQASECEEEPPSTRRDRMEIKEPSHTLQGSEGQEPIPPTQLPQDAQEGADFATELWTAYRGTRSLVPNRRINLGRMMWEQQDHNAGGSSRAGLHF